MQEKEDEFSDVAMIMAKMNKNLEGISEIRQKINEAFEAVGARIETLEKRYEVLPTGGANTSIPGQEERLKTIEKEIEMGQKAVESNQKSLDNLQKSLNKHTHIDLFEKVEEAKKLSQEDNRYLEGLDKHIKAVEENLNDKIKEISKEASKAEKLRSAFKHLIETVMKD